MQLKNTKTHPILKLNGLSIRGWYPTVSYGSSYLQPVACFSNEDDYSSIPNFYHEFYQIIKDVPKKDLVPGILLVIDHIYSDRPLPAILVGLPFPFVNVEFGILADSVFTKFHTIEDRQYQDKSYKWATEYYFQSINDVLKENDVNVVYEVDEEKGFLSLSIEIRDKDSLTIGVAFNKALNNLKRLLKKVDYAIHGLTRFSNVIELWEKSLDNNSERFWQKTFQDHSWVFSLALNQPLIFFQREAYLGGKSISNVHGNIVDFAYKNKLSDNLALIEIKTPKTRIVGERYRDTYSFSKEIIGGINQLLHYRDSILKDYSSLLRNENDVYTVTSPRLVLVIGSMVSLVPGQKRAFELFRSELKSVEIITFDELFEKIFFALSLIEQGRSEIT